MLNCSFATRAWSDRFLPEIKNIAGARSHAGSADLHNCAIIPENNSAMGRYILELRD